VIGDFTLDITATITSMLSSLSCWPRDESPGWILSATEWLLGEPSTLRLIEINSLSLKPRGADVDGFV
jgi:hypothetical protein